jgi:hypothetical protein
VGRSAALDDQKDLDFNVVLSQEGRAKNPALLIFWAPNFSINRPSLNSAVAICHKTA